MKKTTAILLYWLFCIPNLFAQHSVARLWNEVTLDGIRGDLARPTVHARNLFHTSVAMYDAWAIYSGKADTYFLGKTVHGFTCGFSGTPPPENVKAAQEEAISFAMYRLLKHRFAGSPGEERLYEEMDFLMDSLGYNPLNIVTNYKCGPAELGNYIAQQLIAYGLQDGSNEAGGYSNLFYEPVNPPMSVRLAGNFNIVDLNRWQPLSFIQFIDQSGNFTGSVPPFVSPEWGQVLPFSFDRNEATIYQRDGHDYWVYHDPGPPPYLNTSEVGGLSEEYKWGYALVAAWSSLLDPADSVKIDISPASVGNIPSYPTDVFAYHDFYDFFEGGDTGTGYSVNPKTGEAYEPQIVYRADYARVLAEFWADGPDSETPPGHWFTIFNYVNDQPELEKRMEGQGPILDDLEWDVKGYFTLGGAMHDVAVSVWGIKGWYDTVRPVSAIRGMAELGQSSDPSLPNFHPGGLPLIPGYIELIQEGDPLQGTSGEYINEIKLKAWQGPSFITDPRTDIAGVGWVRANFWWPYQRPTFVSPPFAGYVSGHSTYSRAAAEILTFLTGDSFFPGGMGEFYCRKNQFLVFEDGPSTDLTLQWATYQDAADQCSLSRIYGGIHPPADDMPGRFIGLEIGEQAFAFAKQYFQKETVINEVEAINIFPNPTSCAVQINFDFEGEMPIKVYSSDGREVLTLLVNFSQNQTFINLEGLPKGAYLIVGLKGKKERFFAKKIMLL
ncbi:MAG: T9SS type A sorting domain-containing protein [Saprospiraceae bacterium]